MKAEGIMAVPEGQVGCAADHATCQSGIRCDWKNVMCVDFVRAGRYRLGQAGILIAENATGSGHGSLP